MANETRATANLQITQDGFTINGNSTQTLTMTGSNYSGEVFSANTTWQQIPTSSLSDIRYMFLMNNSTASIDISLHTASSSFAQLKPSDVVLLPPSSSIKQYYIKSSLNQSDVQIVLVEE